MNGKLILRYLVKIACTVLEALCLMCLWFIPAFLVGDLYGLLFTQETFVVGSILFGRSPWLYFYASVLLFLIANLVLAFLRFLDRKYLRE